MSEDCVKIVDEVTRRFLSLSMTDHFVIKDAGLVQELAAEIRQEFGLPPRG